MLARARRLFGSFASPRPLGVICVLIVGVLAASATAWGASGGTPSQTPEAQYHWYEGSDLVTGRAAPDRVALILKPGVQVRSTLRERLSALLGADADLSGPQQADVQFASSAVPVSSERLTVLASRLADDSGICGVSPVITVDGSGDWRILSGRVIVQFKASLAEEERARLVASAGLTVETQAEFDPDTCLYRAASPLASLDAVNALHGAEGVVYAEPDWGRPRAAADAPNDPYYTGAPGPQWNLTDQGFESAWDVATGAGQVIGINDTGVQLDHEDLAANFRANPPYPPFSDFPDWDYIDGDGDPSPNPTDEQASHGTCVAGIAAARGNNGTGICGAAPDAQFVARRVVSSWWDSDYANALYRGASDPVCVSNNSWGHDQDVEPQFTEGASCLQSAMANGTTSGRAGRGIAYVFAAGNGDGSSSGGWSSNYSGLANSRYAVAVGASTGDEVPGEATPGQRTDYTEPGANVMLNAAVGTDGVTTTNYVDGSSPYCNDFNGTSAAAPQVSGLVADLLQVNPNLTWRDVQGILIESSDPDANDPAPDYSEPHQSTANPWESWQRNTAGHWVNYYFGFGRLDAAAAVERAQNWPLLGPEVTADDSASPGQSIDYGEPAESEITIKDNMRVEHVDVTVHCAHAELANFDVVLTAPSGTESILACCEPDDAEVDPNAMLDSWRFGTLRDFGEPSRGTWHLTVRQRHDGEAIQAELVSWDLQIYGNKRAFPVASVAGSTQTLPVIGAVLNADQAEPRWVVFRDNRDVHSTYRLYFKDLLDFAPDHGESAIPPSSLGLPGAVCGNTLVYETNNDIWAKDLTSGSAYAICTRGSDQHNPRICGNLVVWEDSRSITSTGVDLWGRYIDPATHSLGTEFPICQAAGPQVKPSVAQERGTGIYGVVWADGRASSSTPPFDVYAAAVDPVARTSSQFLVNAYTDGQGNHWDSATPAYCGYTVVWSASSNTAGARRDIQGKVLDLASHTCGPLIEISKPLEVHDDPSQDLHYYLNTQPSIAESGGEEVVAWQASAIYAMGPPYDWDVIAYDLTSGAWTYVATSGQDTVVRVGGVATGDPTRKEWDLVYIYDGGNGSKVWGSRLYPWDFMP